jgi:hypothetical protein
MYLFFVAFRDSKTYTGQEGVMSVTLLDEIPVIVDELKAEVALGNCSNLVRELLWSVMVYPKGFTNEVFWKVICSSVLEQGEDVVWEEVYWDVGSIVKHHSDLLIEKGEKFVVCLNVNNNSFKPLHVVVSDLKKFFPTF